MSNRAVVVRDEDVEVKRWEHPLRGHLGFRPLVGTTADTNELTAGVAELEPGGWLGTHRHRPAEVYHVLTGTGVLVAGEDAHVVRTGSTVWIPGDLEHGIRNTGHSALRLFYVFAVDSDDQVQYRFMPDP
jgi:quercetin dioxygenase-like cupin family protein